MLEKCDKMLSSYEKKFGTKFCNSGKIVVAPDRYFKTRQFFSLFIALRQKYN